MTTQKPDAYTGLGDGGIDPVETHWQELVATPAAKAPAAVHIETDANAVQHPEADGISPGNSTISASAPCSAARLALFPNEAATSHMRTNKPGRTVC